MVKKVADAYEMLDLLKEKERILEKYNDLFTETPAGKKPKKSGRFLSKKKESGTLFEAMACVDPQTLLFSPSSCAIRMFYDRHVRKLNQYSYNLVRAKKTCCINSRRWYTSTVE